MELTTRSPRDALRIAAVKEHVRQGNRHDIDGVLSTFGEHAVYEDGPWGERHDGMGAVRQYYERLFRAVPDLHIEVKKRHVSDEAVVVESVITGTHRGRWRGFPPTGRHLEFAFCAVYTFDETDRIVGERIYYDRATVFRQLGVLSDPTTLGGRLRMALLHPVRVVGAGLRSAFHR